ncbi:hypothetical protein G9F72_019810 [Clostridium estertheticum]|uniref:hypothetical protein n=1 Tax=Clostridium estertheticum TaxID=238834 RepID=UPI0013E980B6|nr:hypothetical protein [Clostridium estertheticum]MBZ9688578.1 hypothetical protein [Clostridium estertheticum]
MFHIIMGLLMIITGVISIVFGNTPKFIKKQNIKDENTLKKYLLAQRLLYTIAGLSFVIIGRYTLLDPLINWQYNILIGLQLIFILINFVLNKKYKVKNIK